MVTVVDAASIFEQLSTLDMLADRGWQADQGDRRTVPQLLCDQLEFADVLVINKVDLVSEAQLGSVETFVKLVNPQAEVLRTTHSKLEPDEDDGGGGLGAAQVRGGRGRRCVVKDS